MPGLGTLLCFFAECAFIAETGRRRCWPPEFVRQLISVTEDDYLWDCTLDIVPTL